MRNMNIYFLTMIFTITTQNNDLLFWITLYEELEITKVLTVERVRSLGHILRSEYTKNCSKITFPMEEGSKITRSPWVSVLVDTEWDVQMLAIRDVRPGHYIGADQRSYCWWSRAEVGCSSETGQDKCKNLAVNVFDTRIQGLNYSQKLERDSLNCSLYTLSDNLCF